MMKRIVVWLIAGWLGALPYVSQAAEIDRDLLKRTVGAASVNVVPAKNVKVVYEPATEHLYVSFTTQPDHKGSSADSVWRWRSNQWAVLQEFMLSRIPIKFVSVETNNLDEDRLPRYTHSSMHADKYGDIHENRLWLRTATVTQKKDGAETWEKVKSP